MNVGSRWALVTERWRAQHRRDLRTRPSEPAVGAIDVHRAAFGVAGRPLQHGLEIVQSIGHGGTLDRKHVCAHDRRRRGQRGQRLARVERRLDVQRAEIGDAPIPLRELPGQLAERVGEALDEIRVVLEDENSLVPRSQCAAQHAKMAQETPARTDRRKARGLRRTHRLEKLDARVLRIKTCQTQLFDHLASTVGTGRQVDDVDSVEEMLHVGRRGREGAMATMDIHTRCRCVAMIAWPSWASALPGAPTGMKNGLPVST